MAFFECNETNINWFQNLQWLPPQNIYEKSTQNKKKKRNSKNKQKL